MSAGLRLVLATDAGEVLDTVELTWQEWRAASSGAYAALSLLDSLHAGTEPHSTPERVDPADPLDIVTPDPAKTCPAARFGRPHVWQTGAFYLPDGRLIESDDYVRCANCGQVEFDGSPTDPAPADPSAAGRGGRPQESVT